MLYAYNQPELSKITRACFPKNRKPIQVKEFHGPKQVNSYWDGGSKDEYFLYSLAENRSLGLPTSHPYFDRRDNGERCGTIELRELPENCCLVQGGTSCGKPSRITIYFRPENLATLITDQSNEVALSDNAKTALSIIRSFKGGYRKGEFARARIGDYCASNPAIAELLFNGLAKANKAGAIQITLAGQNYG
jgi:hypothetical protein